MEELEFTSEQMEMHREDAAERAYKRGYIDGSMEQVRLWAWWKDGVQYVGTCGKTLKEAEAMIIEEAKKL